MLGPIGPSCKTALEKYGNGDEEKRARGLKQLIKLEQNHNKMSVLSIV